MAESSNPLPLEIRTERLVLRSARAGDGAALREAIGVSLDDFYPWLSIAAQLGDLETMERVSRLAESSFEKGEFYVWRVWDRGGVMIGSVDLHSLDRAVPSCEIGYWLRSDWTGLGFAQEFVSAAIEVARNELGVERIEARCDVRNERAWRLVERLGFSFEGIVRHDERDAAGELCSNKVYALISADVERDRSKSA